jgi:hypothetical protein
MAFIGTIFLFPTTAQTSVADMNYTVVVLGGVIILSLIWYYFPVYGGVHWFTGPVPTVEGRETHKWATHDNDLKRGSVEESGEPSVSERSIS